MRDVWGKRVRETLASEEVLSFYIQFVLGPAKEFKLKTSRVSSPTHKKILYGAMLGAMCGMYSNIGLGGSAVFLHSVCASKKD